MKKYTMPEELEKNKQLENPDEFFFKYEPALVRAYKTIGLYADYSIFNEQNDKFIASIIFRRKQFNDYRNSGTETLQGAHTYLNYYQAAFISLWQNSETNNFEVRLKNFSAIMNLANKEDVKTSFNSYFLIDGQKMLLADIFCSLAVAEYNPQKEDKIMTYLQIFKDQNIDLMQTGLKSYLFALLKNGYVQVLDKIYKDNPKILIDEDLTLGQYFAYLQKCGFGSDEKIQNFLLKFQLEQEIAPISDKNTGVFKL